MGVVLPHHIEDVVGARVAVRLGDEQRVLPNERFLIPVGEHREIRRVKSGEWMSIAGAATSRCCSPRGSGDRRRAAAAVPDWAWRTRRSRPWAAGIGLARRRHSAHVAA